MGEYDPEAEVIGTYIVAFIGATGEVSPTFERKAREKFEQHVGEITVDGWYRLGNVVQVYQELLEDVGPTTIREGGVAAAKHLPFPAKLNLEDAFEELREEQRAVYRSSEVDEPAGNYVVTLTGDNTVRVAITEAYPLTAPFAAGIFEGVITHWGEQDPAPVLEETTPRADEKKAWTVDW